MVGRGISFPVVLPLTVSFDLRTPVNERESIMRVPVSCGSCTTEFTASENAVGKRVKCPTCGESVRVTKPDDDEPAVVRRSSGGRKSKKASPAGGSSPMLIGIAAGGGGVAVLGLVMFLMNYRGGNVPAPPPSNPESNVAASASTPPVSPSAAPSSAPISAPSNPASMAHQVASQSAGNTGAPAKSAAPSGSNPAVMTTSTTASKENVAKTTLEPRKKLERTELIKQVEKSVVRIIVKGTNGASVGSGFVIDTDGSIMTNYHVIEGAMSAEVEFENGKKSAVIGFTTLDKKRDLAIIKIKEDPESLTKIGIATALPEKGEDVAAFGAPRGLSFTASNGIISAIRQTPEFNAREAGTYLQTTTPISPGNSGGPLVNMYGEVVGVNSFKIEGENLNFAASSTDIQEVIAGRGHEVKPLSPTDLEPVFTKKNPFARAENIAGTTKGNQLFGNIRDAIIMMLPFAVDPSGNITSFVDREISKNLITKAKWTEVTRRDQVKKSTAFVVALIYFTADPKKNANAIELMCSIQIIARDVDKDGLDYTAIVYDEHKSLGKISMNSLVGGNIPNGMKEKIPEFFNRIVQDYRKAQRNNANPKSETESK
jgi:S1-C subfamily serine protease/predicted RNA-binding Zn-ribbon protein involved in translation (DUF1610 family)